MPNHNNRKRRNQTRRRGRKGKRAGRGGGGRAPGGPYTLPSKFATNPVAGTLMSKDAPRKLTIERSLRTPGFADRAMVRLRWSKATNLTFTASAAAQSLLYDGNGAFQPGNNFSDTSNPQWWNKYAAVYNNYRVFACNIMTQVEFTFSSASTGGAATVYLFPHNNVGAVTSGTTALNNPQMRKWDIYCGNASSSTVAVPNVNYPTVNGQMHIPKLQGMVLTEFLGDNGNTNVVTSLPTRTAWWEVLIVPKETMTIQVQVWTVLDYLVEFFERLPGDDSTRLLREIALMKREQKLAVREPRVNHFSDQEIEDAKACLNLGLGGTPEQSPSLSWEDVPSFSLSAGGGLVDRGDRKSGIAGGSFAVKKPSKK